MLTGELVEGVNRYTRHFVSVNSLVVEVVASTNGRTTARCALANPSSIPNVHTRLVHIGDSGIGIYTVARRTLNASIIVGSDQDDDGVTGYDTR